MSKAGVACVGVVALLLSSCKLVRNPPTAEAGTAASSSSPVTSIASLPKGQTVGLPKLKGDALLNLERIGETWSPTIKQPVAVAADRLEFYGWAVDEAAKTLAAGVDITIDGVPYSAGYGIFRGDVADYLKRPAYKDSGFLLTVPAGAVTRGRHQATVRVVSKDGKGYQEIAPVLFDVK
ncbi:MAG: hypothetical protein SGI92_19065 [Bryobacteraceae bacterium]|nr:hypothetical protein [Bryobacteraceae bacterium]